MIRLLLALSVAVLPWATSALGAATGPAARCARVHNDDAMRGYDPALHDGIAAAFGRLFPGAPPPDEQMLQVQTHIRCMDGHLLACFTGANLPCGKISTVRGNQGATTFCRANPNADSVPAYATGHDTAYTFRCRSGEAEISGTTFPLDARGFAASLWAPID